MKKHPLNLGNFSAEEQLGNVYDSLAADVFDDVMEIDKETIDRASRIARAAIKDAPTSRSFSVSHKSARPKP
jgi:hypothetical protein